MCGFGQQNYMFENSKWEEKKVHWNKHQRCFATSISRMYTSMVLQVGYLFMISIFIFSWYPSEDYTSTMLGTLLHHQQVSQSIRLLPLSLYSSFEWGSKDELGFTLYKSTHCRLLSTTAMISWPWLLRLYPWWLSSDATRDSNFLQEIVNQCCWEPTATD